MTNLQLIKLLNKNERSQAWLGRKLNLTAMAICKWCKGDSNIPVKRIPEIKRFLNEWVGIAAQESV